MSRRLELHKIFEDIPSVKAAYFQPPPTVKMQYPAIVYRLARPEVKYANNLIYKFKQAYLVTVVDPNPDSEIPAAVAALPYSGYDRVYTADTLNHFVYTVYY